MKKIKYVVIGLIVLFSFHSSFAQTAFTHLLPSETEDIFGDNREVLLEALNERQVEIDLAFVQLMEQEEKLEKAKADVESRGMDATKFFEHIELLLEALPVDEQETLMQGDGSNLNQRQNEIRDYILEARALTSPLLQNLDNHIQDTLDLAMANAFNILKIHFLNSSERSVDLQKMVASLERAKNTYLENKDKYGTGKDARRTGAFSKFFINLQKLYAYLDQLENPPTLSERVKNATSKSLSLLYKMPGIFRHLVFDFAPFLKSILAPSPSTPTQTSFSLRLNQMINSIFKTTEVEIIGKENIPREYDSGEANIFTLSHRDARNDQIVVSRLELNNLITFGAPNNFIPKIIFLKNYLIKKLDDNLGFVVVGAGALLAPIEKILKIFKNSPTRNILIYPGGRLPEGLGSTMGVREKFSGPVDGLVQTLEENGFKVNIIPIAMMDNATLFNEQTPLTGSSVLRVKVGRNINHRTRKVLEGVGGPRALGLLLRYALLDELATSRELLWGQVRASQLESKVGTYLTPEGGLNSCARIF